MSLICRLLEDPDIQITIKILGVFRNVLSGKEVSRAKYLLSVETRSIECLFSARNSMPIIFEFSVFKIPYTMLRLFSHKLSEYHIAVHHGNNFLIRCLNAVMALAKVWFRPYDSEFCKSV